MPTRIELAQVEVISSNPAPFDTPFSIRVVLNVLEDPPKKPVDVTFTWSPIWDFPVDQELDELEVGPFSTVGRHDFVLECDPPNIAEIPDPTGPTAMMVSFQYSGKEFLHLGFNIETVCTLPETPETYTDPAVLTRKIGRCFRKMTDIPWDSAELSVLSPAALAAAPAVKPPIKTYIPPPVLDDDDDVSDDDSDGSGDSSSCEGEGSVNANVTPISASASIKRPREE